MKLLRISLFNIKKKKGAAISLTILIILASLFLNLGLNIFSNISEFYLNKQEELHSPHYVALFDSSKYNPDYLEILKNDSRVDQCEMEEVISMSEAEWSNNNDSNNGEKIPFSTIVQNMDKDNKLYGYKICEQSEYVKDNGIYLPISLKGMGYKLNDELNITYNNKNYVYPVAGFYESTFFATRTTGKFIVYLKNDAFRELYKKTGGAKLIYARMHNIEECNSVAEDFENAIKQMITSTDSVQTEISGTYTDFETANTTILKMFSMFLIIFSIIIVVISMFIVKFRIKNDIEENMTNIGALEALGYTSREILVIYILEFLMAAVLGAFVGTVISYLAMSVVGNNLTMLVGAVWINSLHLIVDFQGILVIILSVFIISLLCGGKIKKLTPVIAFNGGIKNHNFIKNYFPLNHGISNIHFKLSLKRFMSSLNQNIVIGIILTGVTFAVIFCAVLYSNFCTNYDSLGKLLGYEICDLEITATKQTDVDEFIKEIEMMDEVRKANNLDSTKIMVDDIEIYTQICDDFSKMETLNVYEGKLPVYKNEIVLTGLLAENLNKKIGDTVTVKSNGRTAKYIICGLMQTMSNNGKNSLMTIDGIKIINPGFSKRCIQIYLNEGIDEENFIETLNNKYGKISDKTDSAGEDDYSKIKEIANEKIAKALKSYDVQSIDYSLMIDGKIIASGNSNSYKIEKIEKMKTMLNSSLGSIVNVISTLSLIIIFSTIMIIVLILSLVIKAMIIKSKVEFGILKSIGYTTWELMIQIALSFMPAVIIGSSLGAVIGRLSVRPLLTMALHSIGISKFEVELNIFIVLGIILSIVLFTFLVAMIEAHKVKKISVYELLTE